jgi:hypothetical protein
LLTDTNEKACSPWHYCRHDEDSFCDGFCTHHWHQHRERKKKSEARQPLSRCIGRIDKVAYVRFASVYRSFEDVDEFRQLIREI